MKNYNSLLLSATLASLVLVGCGGGGGGSQDTNDTNQANPVKPNEPADKNTTDKNETIVKTITVVDDYVIGASVKDENNNEASYIKDKKHYAFTNFIGLAVSSTGGKIDINGNNIADSNEPNAYKMYASSNKKYINPFTTIAYSTTYTDNQVASMFGLTDIDINTATQDIKIRKAVAIANALINEGSKTSTSTNEKPTVPSDAKDLFPLAATTLQSTIDKFYTLRKTKNGVDSIVEITKDNSYKALNDANLTNLNNFLYKKLKEYETKKTEPTKEESNQGGGNNTGGGGNTGGGSNGNGNTGGGGTSSGLCPDGTYSMYCNGNNGNNENNGTNNNPVVSQSKTKDDFIKAEITASTSSGLIKEKPENINLIRIDRVAYFKKGSVASGANTFTEANKASEADSKEFPPNPPAFPSSITLTADGNNTKITFRINRTSDETFNFMPRYLDYK